MKRAVLPVVALAVLLLPRIAGADPVGFLAITNSPGQGLVVSSTAIDFLPAGGGLGSVDTGVGTDVTFIGGGPLVAGLLGSIRDIAIGAGGVADFLTFLATPTLHFDLLSLTPGGSAQGALNGCAGVTAVGVSCSPLLGGGVVSPFVLTNRGFYTDITLGMSLLGRDLTGARVWDAGLTTQATRLTPDAIQSRFNSGLTVASTFSAMAASSEAPVEVPEPSSAALALLGAIAMCVRRYRQA